MMVQDVTRQKSLCGRERPPVDALFARQNPSGIPGSLPATSLVCFTLRFENLEKKLQHVRNPTGSLVSPENRN